MIMIIKNRRNKNQNGIMVCRDYRKTNEDMKYLDTYKQNSFKT